MIAMLTAGIVLGLSAGISPGPFLALVISQSLAHGAREGIKTAMAPLITDVPIIVVSTLVLMRLAHVHILLGGITLAGGVFVSYLAYDSLRSTGLDAGEPRAQPGSLRKGVLVNALNPHPYLFWLTVGAPIIVRGWAESSLAVVSFLVSFYGCLVGSKIVLAVSVGKSRQVFVGRPYRYAMRALGILLLVFAVLLFRNGLVLLMGSA